MKKQSKKRGVFLLCFVLVFSSVQVCVPETAEAAVWNLTVSNARALALVKSREYKKLVSQISLKGAEYVDAVKSNAEKLRNMLTFRWSPLLSFQFPQRPDLAEAYEFTYKPLQIQSELTGLSHHLAVVKYDIYEETGNLFTEVYTLQENIGFYEERLEGKQNTLKRNKAKVPAGEATQKDVDTMQKDIDTLTDKLGELKRSFEQKKEKLGDAIGLDVTSGCRFLNPYTESSLSRSNLEAIQENALEMDQTFYEIKLNTQQKRVALDTNYKLMKSHYGSKMKPLEPYISSVKAGKEIDSEALKEEYDKFLEKIDAPWNGNIRILFIKIPKEWFKGQLSGVRYIEDEPYTLYTNILEYQEALEEEKAGKKELSDSVEDSFNNVITARNTYVKLAQAAKDRQKEAEAGLLLNRMGDMDYKELAALQEASDDSQEEEMQALSDYTQALNMLDGLSCGAVTDMLYPAGTAPVSVSGGDSLVKEEILEGVFYTITPFAEDNAFELGISVPEGFTPAVTDFELWIDGVQVGERTSVESRLRHLTLDTETAEEVLVRLYEGDTFLADCRIDPLAYYGELQIEGGVQQEETKSYVAEYEITTDPSTGVSRLTVTPLEGVETPAYYTLLYQDGTPLYQEKPVPAEEAFVYLGLLSKGLEDIRVQFYREDLSPLYQAVFEENTGKLKEG